MDDGFPCSSDTWSPFSLAHGMLASFFDSVPASVAVVDLTGRVIMVNRAWRSFCDNNGGCNQGWKGANYLDIADHALDKDAAAIAAGLRSVLSGELPSFDHEYPCHAPHKPRWFRCLISPLALTPMGPTEGAAVMHIDTTERKLAEDRAKAANRAKSEFLASMSHELRTPLNAVIGFSEMLMLAVWGPLDERYRGYGADIHQAGTHLLSMINEVLDLSKVEAGKFELKEETIDLALVVPACLHLIEERARRAQVDLSHSMAERTPRLHADSRLVRQILLNLLSNAVKYTPAGGSVHLRVEATEAGTLRMQVADTGIGIAADDIARVLEPFGQVDSQQARRYQAESTGLGLPLANRFVEMHGGTLSIDSVPGTGTIVSVEFPATRVF